MVLEAVPPHQEVVVAAQDVLRVTAITMDSVVPELIPIIPMAVMVIRRVAMQAVLMWVTVVVAQCVTDLVKDSVYRRAQCHCL